MTKRKKFVPKNLDDLTSEIYQTFAEFRVGEVDHVHAKHVGNLAGKVIAIEKVKISRSNLEMQLSEMARRAAPPQQAA